MVQVTIDTKHDSKDELRSVVKMIQHLLGENIPLAGENPGGDFNTTSEADNGFMNMFGDDSSTSSDSSSESTQPEETVIEDDSNIEIVEY